MKRLTVLMDVVSCSQLIGCGGSRYWSLGSTLSRICYTLSSNRRIMQWEVCILSSHNNQLQFIALGNKPDNGHQYHTHILLVCLTFLSMLMFDCILKKVYPFFINLFQHLSVQRNHQSQLRVILEYHQSQHCQWTQLCLLKIKYK